MEQQQEAAQKWADIGGRSVPSVKDIGRTASGPGEFIGDVARYALPTVAEQGLPGFEVIGWWGMLAPAKTPRPIVEKLNRAVNEALKSQLMAERFKTIGEEAAPGTPEEYAKGDCLANCRKRAIDIVAGKEVK